VSVAALDLTGSGQVSLVTGAGAGGGPHVEVWNANGTAAQSFQAFNSTFTGGATVGAGFVDASGLAGLLVAPSNTGGITGVNTQTGGTAFDRLGNFFTTNSSFTGTLQGVPSGAIADLPFLLQASQANQLQTALGQLAAARGGSQAVQSFGAQLAQTGTTAQTNLTSAFNTFGSSVTLPSNLAGAPLPGLTTDASQLVAQLSQLSGSNFDQAFANYMVASQQQSLALTQAEATSGQSSAVQTFASNGLPNLQSGLQSAQQLQTQVGTPTSGSGSGTTTV